LPAPPRRPAFEPGVRWGWVNLIARFGESWVLTDATDREYIEVKNLPAGTFVVPADFSEQPIISPKKSEFLPPANPPSNSATITLLPAGPKPAAPPAALAPH
jgi:hypothetical protein